jgi:glutathione S-transferase
MRLYHQPRTRSTRILWALEEIGEPYDLQVISREDKAEPWYRAIHPLGQSPAATLDGGPMFESAALVWQIADEHPGAALAAPVGGYQRALQYQWSFFGMTELEGPLMESARQLWGETPDAAIVERANARFARNLAPVDALLGGREFLVGDALSVADIVLGSVVAFARIAELAPLPDAVNAYVDRLEARPALQRARAVQAQS